jgi:hypothetical protein
MDELQSKANARDQNWDYAVFKELSSCPTTMEASRSCDAYGTMPGHDAMQATAEQAYIRAKLFGTKTWVELPSEDGLRTGSTEVLSGQSVL